MAATPCQHVFADTYDEQINALKSQISAYQDQAAQLKAQADTLQNKINTLAVEKSQLQAQINLNTAKVAQLEQQIAETNQKIEDQKALLANNLVNLYVDNAVTPLEMLASSSNISEYIDKQEYRETIRSSLQDSIAEVKDLEAELSAQKTSTEQALADQQSQRDQITQNEAEQSLLLAQTQGQEEAYQTLVTQSNEQIATLRAQQAAANLKWAGGSVSYETGGGGYPAVWANAVQDSLADDWGMYNRECVSFAAFKVAASGRYMPYGLGNANQWPSRAAARGISVDATPKAGDVAIWPVGYYGHAMYVYSVSSDGSLFIGEYNYDYTGRYSERTVSASTWKAQGFEFVHF